MAAGDSKSKTMWRMFYERVPHPPSSVDATVDEGASTGAPLCEFKAKSCYRFYRNSTNK